jgi:hypothetical protein
MPRQCRYGADATRTAGASAPQRHRLRRIDPVLGLVHDPRRRGWGPHWYDGLTLFFEAAAGADDALLVWLA